jgi:hypothetical protein
MKLTDCLQQPIFQIPCNPGTASIDSYLKEHFQLYLQTIAKISEPHILKDIDPNIPDLAQAANALVQNVSFYMQGRLFQSKDHLSLIGELFKKNGCHSNQLWNDFIRILKSSPAAMGNGRGSSIGKINKLY